MNRFSGRLCPVCRLPFTDKDDIVVCPDCGTPHHRACFSKENRCALTDLHASGFVWNGRLPDEPEPAILPKIPEKEDIEDVEDVDLPEEVVDALEEIDPSFVDFIHRFHDSERGEDGVSMKELVAYTSTSLFHYGRAFDSFRNKIDGKKRKISFNLCSGLFAPAFQFYRKMDMFGLIVIIALLLPSIAAVLFPDFILNGGGIYIVNVVNIAEVALLCVFGDYIYYRHAVRKIIKFRAAFDGNTCSDEYFSRLSEKGRPSFLRAVVGFLLLAIAEAGLLVLPGILLG